MEIIRWFLDAMRGGQIAEGYSKYIIMIKEIGVAVLLIFLLSGKQAAEI